MKTLWYIRYRSAQGNDLGYGLFASSLEEVQRRFNWWVDVYNEVGGDLAGATFLTATNSGKRPGQTGRR